MEKDLGKILTFILENLEEQEKHPGMNFMSKPVTTVDQITVIVSQDITSPGPVQRTRLTTGV